MILHENKRETGQSLARHDAYGACTPSAQSQHCRYHPAQRWLRRALPFLVCLLAVLSLCAPAQAYLIISAPMTGTNPNGWVLGGTPNSAVLTGNGATDPVGDGWLRLTNNLGNQTGYAYDDTTAFTLQDGLVIQFDYATYGGSGADGYSVYLFDANVPAFNIGAFGGSLGYAQKLPPTVNPAVPGISGGYVGIGVDEFGNFSNPTEGRYQGPGANPNTITIRGSVAGFGGGAIGSTAGATSYPWIATSAAMGSLDSASGTRPSQTGSDYRKVIITISPAPNPVANVWVEFGYGTPPVHMITNQALPAISTTQQLKIGYAASTGGSTNYHEIRNLLVTSQYSNSAIDLGITKEALDTSNNPLTSLAVGDPIRYRVTATNYGPNNITATGVGIVDTLPSELSGASWTCAASGGASCGATSGSGSLNTTANLPVNGAVTYTVDATLNSLPPGNQLTNTANLVIPGAVSDYNANNDSASVTVSATATLPATGNKPLYLYGASGFELSRTKPTGTPVAITINSTGTNYREWALSPALQMDDTISDSAVSGSAAVPVHLTLRDNGHSRNFTVMLYCSNDPSKYLTANGSTSGNGNATFQTISLPFTAQTSSIDCPQGSSWVLRLTNTTNRNNRSFDVYPVNGSNYSNVTLPSENVINVDSVTAYDAAYSGGTALTSAAPGQTVYIRATVSDPFGSFDITGAKLTLTDPTGTVKINNATMTEVNDSGAATKIYEYQPTPGAGYTIPASASSAGTWSIKVTTTEGTEGQVTHSGTASLPVFAAPTLTVLKSATSDGTTAITSASPGTVFIYRVQIENTGDGPATNVVLTDHLSPYTSFGVDAYSGAPFLYSAGSSGLTLGTPVYSNDGGISYGYTPAATGYDGNVTNWKIPMTGTMAAGSQIILNYKVQVK